jgi:hypothetical protein
MERSFHESGKGIHGSALPLYFFLLNFLGTVGKLPRPLSAQITAGRRALDSVRTRGASAGRLSPLVLL